MKLKPASANQRASLLTLSYFGKIGPRGYAKLKEAGDPSVLTGPEMVKAGIKAEIAEEFVHFRAQFEVDSELEKLAKQNISIVLQDDEAYPPLLKEIPDPPFLLYYRGSLEPLHRASLAVVGSRKHTHYGPQIVERVIPVLAANGITIVSGLALGIDGLAHKSVLASGGVTVGVIACGLDTIYPAEHRGLAEKMIEYGGAIISEYPPGTPPLKQHFPARNRIISGLCQGVLIVECDVKSGAMITAHHALDQNREVYAVPGPITSEASAGPNNLLRMGAHVVTSYADVLEAFGLREDKKTATVPKASTQAFLPPHELEVFQALGTDPVHIDTLAYASKLEMAEVNSALLFLEMKGLVQNVGAAQYIRK